MDPFAEGLSVLFVVLEVICVVQEKLPLGGRVRHLPHFLRG